MKRSEVDFIKWNEFTSRWSEPIQLYPPASGTVMNRPEMLTVARCMSGPIHEPRIRGINPIPWLVTAGAVILAALAVTGII